MVQNKPKFRVSTTHAEREGLIIAEYRRYIRMGLAASALALLSVHHPLLDAIDPDAVLRDAERGIK